MKMVRDRTGRFVERPYYEPAEIDVECENLVAAFHQRLYGRAQWPITTDDLTKLLEGHVADLDLFADLSGLGIDVEGVTDFVPGRPPRVRVSAALSRDRMDNRLRTTLTHELGHVHFHRYMFDVRELNGDLFGNGQPWGTGERGTSGLRSDDSPSHQCRRETILQAPEVDWMEWQAGYACGAILMPITPLRSLVHEFVRCRGLVTGIAAESADAHELVTAVLRHFGVSRDAAHVRLLKTKVLLNPGSARSVFE